MITFLSTLSLDGELVIFLFVFFQEQVEKLKALHVDSAEYSCLKAIVLFTTGKFKKKILFLILK